MTSPVTKSAVSAPSASTERDEEEERCSQVFALLYPQSQLQTQPETLMESQPCVPA